MLLGIPFESDVPYAAESASPGFDKQVFRVFAGELVGDFRLDPQKGKRTRRSLYVRDDFGRFTSFFNGFARNPGDVECDAENGLDEPPPDVEGLFKLRKGYAVGLFDDFAGGGIVCQRSERGFVDQGAVTPGLAEALYAGLLFEQGKGDPVLFADGVAEVCAGRLLVEENFHEEELGTFFRRSGQGVLCRWFPCLRERRRRGTAESDGK